jgi:predicted lysophospholipase L1 biosynthesis ABC-type transport system permease subunit
MEEKQLEPLETISEIRSMMERSSRFLSLNGLSGVFAGLFALVGAIAASWYLNNSLIYISDIQDCTVIIKQNDYIFFFADAFFVLLASIAVALFFSLRKAKKNGLAIWDKLTKRLLINFLIPLTTGGLFCLILLNNGVVGLIAPSMRIFYGLALVNASKYTYNNLMTLGIIEAIIGLASAVFIGYGLLFWAIGFGIVHIIYGIVMYYKYEK